MKKIATDRIGSLDPECGRRELAYIPGTFEMIKDDFIKHLCGAILACERISPGVNK